MLHETNQPPGKLSGKDVSTFTKAYKYLFTALCAFADRIVKSVQVAKDIVQDVFTKLWEKSVSFSRYEKVRSWLYTATKRASINYSTRNRYRHLSATTINSLLTDFDGKNEMETDILVKQIAVAVAKMPKQRKRVFVMAHLHNNNTDVIAKRLGIAPATVLSHRSLAMDDIRAHLRKYRETHG